MRPNNEGSTDGDEREGSVTASNDDDEPVGELVPDPAFAREIGVSLVTIWRRDHEPEPPEGWPTKIPAGARNFRSRPQIEFYKRLLMSRARGRHQT